MPQEPLSVFLSYAGSERAQALQVRRELELRGFRVLMDDNFFEPGYSVLVNMGRAVESADIVLPVVSAEYLDRPFTEIEISAVMTMPGGVIVPVVIGPEPVARTDAGRQLWIVLRGRSYFHLELTSDSFDRLASMARDKVRETARRVTRPIVTPIRELAISPGRELCLIYDWEDVHLLDDIEAQLRERGVSVADATPAILGSDAVAASISTIGVVWTTGAKVSPEIGAVLRDVATKGLPLVHLRYSDGPTAPAGTLAWEMGRWMERREDDADVESMNESEIEAGLQRALASNDGVPFHILGDKFCANRETATAVEGLYQAAVAELPPHNPTRLGAALAYAAVKRFRGDWAASESILDSEPRPQLDAADFTPVSIAIQADLLSLSFELGRVGRVTEMASQLRTDALRVGDWPTVIAMHRQLGMVYEEQGDHSSARDHLERAAHFCEDLLDTPLLVERVPSRPARLMLWADCLRELAALEWRSGQLEQAFKRLQAAAEALDAIAESNASARYLRSVIDYQTARVRYSAEPDYETAQALLQAAYQSLQRFDNPVRVATVLESLVRLEIEFIRRPDPEVAAALRLSLEKIRRVRTHRRHDYLIARANEAMGDLEMALGEWPAATRRYADARRAFNRLAKVLDAAKTSRLLGRSLMQEQKHADGLRAFNWSVSKLTHPDHRALLAEIQAELATFETTDLVAESMSITATGEYAIHRWLEAQLSARGKHGIVQGIGDDAAVLRLGADEHFVVSTDSVPTVILATQTDASAAQAARFAVVTALSDVIAMGAAPVAILLNLHVRRSTSIGWVRRLLETAHREAGWYGATVVGGDLRERDREALTVVAIGTVKADRHVSRDGAAPGDLLGITLSSAPGLPAQGLGARWAAALVPSLSEAERDIITRLTAGDAALSNFGLPIQFMQAAVGKDLLTAAMDTSDGVLACTQAMGEASNVGFELFPDAIAGMINDDATRLAVKLGVAPFLFALNGGHDWEIAFTASPQRAGELDTLMPRDDSTFPAAAIIGRAVRRGPWAKTGVRLARGGSPHILPFFTGEKFRSRTNGPRARDWLDFARHATRVLGENGFGSEAE